MKITEYSPATAEILPFPDKDKANKQKRNPRHLPNDNTATEDSVALQFAEEHAGKLKYCHQTGAWFVWNGNIWHKDGKQVAFQWARELSRRVGEDHEGKIRSSLGRKSFASGVEAFAKSDPEFSVEMDFWDCDEFLLGTPEGTVDLRTGQLRPGNPADGITKSTLCAPAKIGCPLWLKFLDEATGGNQELIRFLQQWAGYCLTGSIKEHAFVFACGDGGNGKGTWLNVMTKIIGDYATTAAMETFTTSKQDRHSTELASLRGARLVKASETEQGRAWAEAKIKVLTGGDHISARFMRQDAFEFDPQFKLTIIGNHQPVLHNVDEAMRRRINMIPFTRKPAVIDRDLEAKLMAEAPGILRWMIEGCLDWQANGLIRPDVVNVATANYFADQDTFGQWLDECCIVAIGNSMVKDSFKNLFDDWKVFAKNLGQDPGDSRRFKENMGRQGIVECRTNASRGYQFVRLKPR
jgi:putative DNA primase/helicase